jgi:hypothetical protein
MEIRRPDFVASAGNMPHVVEGLRTSTLARDDRIRDLVPFPLTPFEKAARAAFEKQTPDNRRTASRQQRTGN